MKQNQYISQIIKKISKRKPYKIVFIGDSITSTEWVHPNWREIIEYVLKEELNKIIDDWKTPSWFIRTINSGLDGSTSADWLDYLDSYVLNYKPDLVISIFGGNDETFNLSTTTHASNMQKIINQLSEKVPQSIFCSTTPGLGDIKINQYQPYYQALKQVEFPDNVKFLDLFSIYQKFNRDPLFTFISEDNPDTWVKAGEIDPDHPNQLGNAYIAKVILEDIFSIDFNPEQYINDTISGEKYPRYQSM